MEVVMSEGTNSIKKVAVLTGLTMLVGGAEIIEANAATVTETHTFLFSASALRVRPRCVGSVRLSLLTSFKVCAQHKKKDRLAAVSPNPDQVF
jgi:hypothetical protein